MRCLRERVAGKVTIVDLASRAMIGELSTDVTDKVTELVGRGCKAVVLNLDGVMSVDSRGLGDLVGAHKAAVTGGGSVKLSNLHERVSHPLRIMNLSKMLEAFDTEEEAVSSFDAGTPGKT